MAGRAIEISSCDTVTVTVAVSTHVADVHFLCGYVAPVRVAIRLRLLVFLSVISSILFAVSLGGLHPRGRVFY